MTMCGGMNAATRKAPASSAPFFDNGTKRRARRLAPKVCRRKLSDSDGGSSGSYVEFLQFIRSPPGTTLGEVERKTNAARLAAALAAGDSSKQSPIPAVLDERRSDPEPEPKGTGEDALLSMLDSLAISGRNGNGTARDNYSALTSMLDLDDENDYDDDVPNLDEASWCTSPTSEAGEHEKPRETSADNVLAWTALSMLLGQGGGPIVAPQAKKGGRGGTTFFAHGDEAVPEVPPSPVQAQCMSPPRGRTPTRERRYDSVDATSPCPTSSVEDLLTSVMCSDHVNESLGSREMDPPEETTRAREGGAVELPPTPQEQTDQAEMAIEMGQALGGVVPPSGDPTTRTVLPEPGKASHPQHGPHSPKKATTSSRPVFRLSPAQPTEKRRPRGFAGRLRETAKKAAPRAFRKGLRRARVS